MFLILDGLAYLIFAAHLSPSVSLRTDAATLEVGKRSHVSLFRYEAFRLGSEGGLPGRECQSGDQRRIER
jgi:hypothetical protein